MQNQLSLRSLLQATLTCHFLERKTGRYQLYTADQVRVAVEDTNVDCPWNLESTMMRAIVVAPQVVMSPNMAIPQMIPGAQLFGLQVQQQLLPQAPNPLYQMMLQEVPKMSFQENPAIFPRFQPRTGPWSEGWEKSLSDARCSTYFAQYAPAVVKALEAHPGQLFVAGGCFSDMFLQGRPVVDGDFDLFVCAESAQEGEKVMRSAAAILEREMANKSGLGIVNVTTTTQATSFSSWDNLHYYTQKVQIIRRLYPVGRHDMIPGCFDLWPSQFIWSPSTGLQATLPGLVSLIIRGFPIDLARRSPAMMKRITKYVERKSFTCYLMGVDPENPQREFGWTHPTNSKIGEKFISTDLAQGTYWGRNSFGIDAEYDFPNEEARGEEAEHRMFIEENPTVWDNLRCALSEKPHILLRLSSYVDFCTKRCNIGLSLLNHFVNLKEVERMNRKTLRKFFKDEAIRIKFAAAYFGAEDKDESQRLWAENIVSLSAPFVPLFCGQTDASVYWKVDNPGAQGFGQNCPRPIHPRDYYGKSYYPTICGIPPVEVLAVRYLKKKNNWPLDVERLLCRYLLAMHASDVYRMLKQ